MKEIQMEPSGNLEELLSKLCDKYGEKFESKLLDNKKTKEDVVILINGITISKEENENIKLQDHDIISIMTIITGG